MATGSFTMVLNERLTHFSEQTCQLQENENYFKESYPTIIAYQLELFYEILQYTFVDFE